MTKDRTVIVLANRKGGVGKTKGCIYIAECLRVADHKVIGIDLDPEKGWIKLHKNGALKYDVIEANAKTLKTIVQALEGFVVIDTPPNDVESLMKACLLADEVFVPLAATGDDMSRLDSTLAEIVAIEEARGVPLTTVYLNRWDGRKNISKETLELMNRRDIPVADQKIRYLTEYERFGPPLLLDEYNALLKEVKVL